MKTLKICLVILCLLSFRTTGMPQFRGATFFMHYLNLSLENLVDEIDGVCYEEEWKDITGYEGHFKISSFGRIKSINRYVRTNNPRYRKRSLNITEKIRVQIANRKGYLLCVLRHPDIKMKGYAVHRLVAKEFIYNPDNKQQVNHKKGNKKDNRWLMLEWVTPKENSRHSIETGLQKIRTGFDNKKSIPVDQYDLEMNYIKSFSNAREAMKITGVLNGCIGQVCLGKQRTAGGYIWKYKNS